jgi:hypothetical protein
MIASTDRSKHLRQNFTQIRLLCFNELQKYRDTIQTGMDSSSKTLTKQIMTRYKVLNSNGRTKNNVIGARLTLRDLLRGHDGAPGHPLGG